MVEYLLPYSSIRPEIHYSNAETTHTQRHFSHKRAALLAEHSVGETPTEDVPHQIASAPDHRPILSLFSTAQTYEHVMFDSFGCMWTQLLVDRAILGRGAEE